MPVDREQIKNIVRELLADESATPISPEDKKITDESLKHVITHSDVLGIPTGETLLIREGAIVTPSAQDAVRERNITITYRKSSQRVGQQRIVALGTDHGGFPQKEQLKKFLSSLGYQHRDFGTSSEDAVDYPDYAHLVARAVADRICDIGIILDGAGIGSCMTANKVPGIRAAMCYDEATARNSREHNYANILTLGAKLLTFDQIKSIVKEWLVTDEGEARHGKRVAKIMAIEKQYLKS